MPDKIIHVESIGNVRFRKNKRSKHVTISIRPIKGVVVNLPYYASYRFALRVVQNKIPWILDHLPKVEKIEDKMTVFNQDTEFYTKYRKLVVSPEQINTVKTLINGEKIHIQYPGHMDINNSEIQKIIRQTIIKALRLEAKSYLPFRTSVLAKQFNFKFNKIFIKNNQTVWGSCSGINNINLNLHLMRLPDHLIDYVIIHELCHTKEKNHGKPFWSLMDSILGDAKKISKELKNYSIQLY